MAEELIITNFKLSYNGMYKIKWTNLELQSEPLERRVDLSLGMILKMLAVEGYSFEDVIQHEKSWKPLCFSKVKLKAIINREGDRLSFHTSELSEIYPDNLYMIDVELVEE